MNNQRDSFIRKFTDALKYLGGNSIHDLVSIKYRGNTSNADYRELIEEYLKRELNLETREVQGNFQGHAWLVSDHAHHQALLVEHETGLEVIYIAGSIASLLSLIPLINSGWKLLQRRFSDRPSFNDRGNGIELRIIDSNNQLMEQRVLRIEDHILSESMKEIASLRTRVELLERGLLEIKEEKSKKSRREKPILSSQKGLK